jgi:putative heme transporter
MARAEHDRINPRYRLAASYAWRFLVLAAAFVLLLWIAGQMLVVVIPLGVAALAGRALWPINNQLRKKLPPALASLVCVFGLIIALSAALGLAGVALAGEADQVAPTVEAGIDDILTWIAEESPLDVTREQVDDVWEQIVDGARSFLQPDQDGIASSARLAAEFIAGFLLALVITFFVLKDAPMWGRSVLRRVGPARREVVERGMLRGWEALGGYLRGVVILGTVEAVAIGLAMFIVGANLVAPVMLLTFLAAFIPLVGAILAGAVAVLVTLVTVGLGPALIVLAVAVLVQNFDNDVLAPVVYGRALRLNPLVVLLSIAAGGALFGLIGAVFAVPTVAITLNIIDEWRLVETDQPSPVDTDGDIAQELALDADGLDADGLDVNGRDPDADDALDPEPAPG